MEDSPEKANTVAMNLISLVFDHAAPIFLVTAPLTSYADQIYSMHKFRTSAGFSLDIPLIMLVSSILKVFYWFGAYYSASLLAQAIVMSAVQMVQLKVALDNRPSPGVTNGIEHAPFSGVESGGGWSRPYEFWQWKTSKPYWMFLAYFTAALTFVHIFITPISRSEAYINLLGCVGLAVEAFLPVPQILANQRSKSCKGFRVSLLAAWLIGDTAKMGYFFFSQDVIPWSFRLCGTFQCVCDGYLGVQYWMFTRGSIGGAGGPLEQGGSWQEQKDIRMTNLS